jgi:hypothetical protein
MADLHDGQMDSEAGLRARWLRRRLRAPLDSFRFGSGVTELELLGLTTHHYDTKARRKALKFLVSWCLSG